MGTVLIHDRFSRSGIALDVFNGVRNRCQPASFRDASHGTAAIQCIDEAVLPRGFKKKLRRLSAMNCLMALTRLSRPSPGLLPFGCSDYPRISSGKFLCPAGSRRPVPISEDFVLRRRFAPKQFETRPPVWPGRTRAHFAASISEGRRFFAARKRPWGCNETVRADAKHQERVVGPDLPLIKEKAHGPKTRMH